MPPKTWKRTLPSSGRWSFTLALESTRMEPPSPSPPAAASGNGGADTKSTTQAGGGGDEAAAVQQQNQQLELDGSLGEGGSASPSGADGQTKEQIRAQENGTLDDAGSPQLPPEVDASATSNTHDTYAEGDSSVGRSQEASAAAAAVSTKEPASIDNWPGRAVCREVAEKTLGWEFQDGDFCVPPKTGLDQEEGEAAGGGMEDTQEQREDTAAVKAALARRQVKLRASLRDVRTNEEEAGVGVGSG